MYLNDMQIQDDQIYCTPTNSDNDCSNGNQFIKTRLTFDGFERCKYCRIYKPCSLNIWLFFPKCIIGILTLTLLTHGRVLLLHVYNFSNFMIQYIIFFVRDKAYNSYCCPIIVPLHNIHCKVMWTIYSTFWSGYLPQFIGGFSVGIFDYIEYQSYL